MANPDQALIVHANQLVCAICKVLIFISPFLVTGCFTPNLFGETPPAHLEPRDFGPKAEAVKLRVDEQEWLRGIFVDAGKNAPVVLHLLGGGETLTARHPVAGKVVWVGDTIRDLVSLGLSSLVVDYRGVGRSDGHRHSRYMLADARVAWTEALRRAQNDPRRVIIRATSLGTLAAASLIQDGTRPGALILIAPLRSETVAIHWLRARRSALIAQLARLFLRHPLPVKQELSLQVAGPRQLVILGLHDELLPPPEQQALVTVACSAGATVVERDQDHLALMRDARRVLPEERAYYESFRQSRLIESPSLVRPVCPDRS